MTYPRLRDLREDSDLTQKEVAEFLHVKQNSYSQYETGARTIPMELIIKLADYYNTSIEYIVGQTNIK